MVKGAFGADGVNIVSNLGEASGQVVFHPHFHVIPRREGDGLIKHPGPADGMIGAEAAAACLESLAKAAVSA